MQPWSHPPPPPPATGNDSDSDGEEEKKKGSEVAVAARDINGLVITEGQAASTESYSASLRPLSTTTTLSEIWRPRRERLEPDYQAPHPWQPPHLPTLLQGADEADYLSDDSESDVEDEDTNNGPTWEQAKSLFDVEVKDVEEEGKGVDDTKQADDNEESKDTGAKAAGPATEIPRDRARLALAARERQQTQQAAGWLETRLRAIDNKITDPYLRFQFDAVPRIRWS